jgi:hypothetical protein
MTLSSLLINIDPNQKIKVIGKDKVVHETGHPLADVRKLVYFHGSKEIYKIDVSPEQQLRIYLKD